MVDVRDRFNHEFKKELIRKALRDSSMPKLIIAVDWTKFNRGIMGADLVPVLGQEEWDFVKADSSFVLVATKPDDSDRTPNATRSRDEIDKFNFIFKCALISI